MAPVVSVEMAPVATVEVTPLPSVEMAPIASVEMAPVVSVEMAPVVSVEMAPVVSVEMAPVASVEMAPVVSVEMAPVVSVEMAPVATVEVTPLPSVEMVPVVSVEMAPIASVEMAPVVSVEMAPIASVEMAPVATVEMAPVARDDPCVDRWERGMSQVWLWERGRNVGCVQGRRGCVVSVAADMGNEGSKGAREDSGRAQQPRGKVATPVAKCSPLRPDPVIGVDSSVRDGDGTHLDDAQVKGATVATGKPGKQPGGDPTSQNHLVDAQHADVAKTGAEGNVGRGRGRNETASGPLLGKGWDTGVRCEPPTMEKLSARGYSERPVSKVSAMAHIEGPVSKAEQRIVHDAATGVATDSTNRKYGNSTLYVARAQGDRAETSTVGYEAVVSCADIKLVDATDSQDLSPRTRCFVFGSGQAVGRRVKSDAGDTDGKPCHQDTSCRPSPEGESVHLDLSPKGENAKFTHMGGHSQMSSHQKDDYSGGDSLDDAGSPLQYEDCVEYIESGHSSSLTSVTARDRPVTEGHEVLVESDRRSLPATQVSGKIVTSNVDTEDISGGVTADSCEADPGHQAGDRLSSDDTAEEKPAKETGDMADVSICAE